MTQGEDVKLSNMVSQPIDFQEIVNRIVVAAAPRKILLFGSHARGTAHTRSDLDVMVIESEVQSPTREAIRLRKTLIGLGIALDLLVVSEKNFEELACIPGTVYAWAKREGKVLYEAAA